MKRIILSSANSPNHVFWDTMMIDKTKRYKCTLVNARVIADGAPADIEYALSIRNNTGFLHDITKTYGFGEGMKISFDTVSVSNKDTSILVNPDFFKDYTCEVTVYHRTSDNIAYTETAGAQYTCELIFEEI